MSIIKKSDLKLLNQDINLKGHVDREHLLKFLTLIPNTDGQVIVQEVRDWLQGLHDDPTYANVIFPQGDIDAILGDLDSYGKVSSQTIQQFKQTSNKVVPQTS